MASPQECKKLLDNDPNTTGKSASSWKRLSKKNASDGVEGIFSNGL